MSEYTMDLDLLIEWDRTKDLHSWQRDILYKRLIEVRRGS
jgi:hypothetical protein